MSTRSIIVITGTQTYKGGRQTLRLYKGSDGYPTEALEVIASGIEQAQAELVSHENRFRGEGKQPPKFKDFFELLFTKGKALGVDPKRFIACAGLYAGKIIGCATSPYGMGAIIEESFDEPLKPEHVGGHFDTEWEYVVDLVNRDVSVYRRYESGVEDPLTYVKQIRDECKEAERTEIQAQLDRLEALGWTLNCPAIESKTKGGSKRRSAGVSK